MQSISLVEKGTHTNGTGRFTSVTSSGRLDNRCVADSLSFTHVLPFLFCSFVAALGNNTIEDLADKLGIPEPELTPTVEDAFQNPKAIASTYYPPQPKVQKHSDHQRGNAGHVQNIQQIGGGTNTHTHEHAKRGVLQRAQLDH
jgi:hypothetical protein